MLRISQLKLPVTHTEEDLKKKIVHTLMCRTEAVQSYEIIKQSLDARKKPELFYVYTVDVKADNEKQLLKMLTRKKRAGNVQLHEAMPYVFPAGGNEKLKSRPVVVGCGPAGLFCAYFLAEYGYQPVLLEQGAPVEERQKDVEEFWKTGVLKPDSNVQFGEGGAGTFSDGKLNTLIKDPVGRNRKVLEIFVENGAPKDILYVNKPHIGTDILRTVIRNMREKILVWGGEIHFHTQMTEVLFTENTRRIRGIVYEDLLKKEKEEIQTETLVLAPGHSARETFAMLFEKKVPMEAKSFAVGVRAEHPQELINHSQYGDAKASLPAAAYKLTAKLPDGRGVYSFCMCPGGRVVASASEDGGVVTNGMSYFARDGKNANSALLVNVTPSDFKTDDPLAGMYFQREIEQRAFEVGGKNYNAPCQRVGDFLGTESNSEYTVEPTYKPNVTWVNLDEVFPKFITDSMREGIVLMDNKLHGFADNGAVITGPETRSSSPVRIIRDKKTMQSNIKGLYPCGEGAGYAGGIMSAAVDGIKTAEMVVINNGRGKNEQ